LQKLNAICSTVSAKTFHDIDGNGERGAAKLRSQLKALESRKSFRYAVKADEKVIRSLPCDKGMMRERHARHRAIRVPDQLGS
jgi:hypothetical protein